VDRRRNAFCEKNGGAKLSREQAIAIRNSSASTDELLAIYQVSRSAINKVRRSATWAKL
jgi:hypothetical protein